MHRKVAAALIAALALAVASCGSSEETLTGAQLVRRIETACKEGQREGLRQNRAARGADARMTFVTAMIAGQKKELDALDHVTTTGAAKADLEAFKAGVQARIDVIERVASADRADFERALADARPAAEAALRKIETSSRKLGVRGCQ